MGMLCWSSRGDAQFVIRRLRNANTECNKNRPIILRNCANGTEQSFDNINAGIKLLSSSLNFYERYNIIIAIVAVVFCAFLAAAFLLLMLQWVGNTCAAPVSYATKTICLPVSLFRVLWNTFRWLDDTVTDAGFYQCVLNPFLLLNTSDWPEWSTSQLYLFDSSDIVFDAFSEPFDSSVMDTILLLITVPVLFFLVIRSLLIGVPILIKCLVLFFLLVVGLLTYTPLCTILS